VTGEDPRDAQARVRAHELAGQRPEPSLDRPVIPALEEPRGPVLGDELRRLLAVAGRDRVPDRAVGVAVRQEPASRAPVQLRDHGRLGALQLASQELAEEVVVAVPLAALVQRDQEQVRPLDLGERGGGVAAGDRIADRHAEPLEDRRAEEEVADVAAQPSEHLAAEVVDDVTVVAGEVADEPAGVVLVAE
jgi:hypothetical protein